jgi:hypothetical protein
LACAPAIPLAFLGGILLDKIGIRMAIIIYTTIVTLGGLLILLGGSANNFITILIGKILCFCGGEVLTGAISKNKKIKK